MEKPILKTTGMLLIVLFSVSMFTGCTLFQKRYVKTEKKEISVNTTGKKKIILSNTNGDIRVVKNSGDSLLTIKAEATFHLTKKEMQEEGEKIRFKLDTNDNVIRINMDFVRERKFRFFNVNFGSDINYDLYVPEGIDVNIDNTNGKTEIENITNNIIVDITNGNVNLSNTPGNVRVETVNGKVTCELDSTKGVDIKTTNGSVTMKLSRTFTGRFRLETVNGKINKKDFDFKDVDDEKKYFKGTLGNSDVDVKIETTNGKISLQKKY